MMFKFDPEVRPLRLIYSLTLIGLAAYLTGWVGALLVGLMGIDVTLRAN